ncbi:hypothetical protein SCLCIDRAFT_28313 [Scleroderma citrinum Foug A]|uniref:Uncharacterized protein n=1 Tax=Scleroderma citrinum Foug A TaxID=1036808 RepID=A0A0C3A0F6_9AGAM|nr:hypothetical protein SCLCIDRAFT_28313 [Scleroderma citrinum Foug A]
MRPVLSMIHAPSAEPCNQATGQLVGQPSAPEDEMATAIRGAEQIAAAADHPGDIQMMPPQSSNPMEGQSNRSGGQNQRPKPRPVHIAAGHMQPTNSEDVFNLRSRIYPTCASGVEETTLTSASARLVAAEEGLVGKSQEGHAMLGGSHDLQPPKVSQSPGHQEMCTPYPAPASYDGANPFAPCPPQLLKQSPEQLPGPGMRPFYPQQPDIGHGDNHMQYSVHGHAGWYTSRPGPYAPMPYIPQQYHPA